MQGPKTHDQQLRILERKEGLAAARDRDAARAEHPDAGPPPATGASDDDNGAFPHAAATNRESRGHNKHNNTGQGGHKPQAHGPAEEKS